jgi:hypothetical protein
MNNIWRSSTSGIIGSLIASLVTPLALAIVILLMFAMAVDQQSVKILEMAGVVGLIGGVAMLAFYIWYCVSLGRFASAQTTPEDKSNARKILYANLFIAFGTLFALIINAVITTSTPPSKFTWVILPLIITASVPLIGYGMMRDAFDNLYMSTSFSEPCKRGFKDLRLSATLLLIGIVINFGFSFLLVFTAEMITPSIIQMLNIITLLVGLTVLVLGIIALVKTFTGWSKVKKNGPGESQMY